MQADIIDMQSHMDFIIAASMHLEDSMQADIIDMQSHMDFIIAAFMQLDSMHASIIIMQSSIDFIMAASMSFAFIQADIMVMQLFIVRIMVSLICMFVGAIIMHWLMHRYIMVMQPFIDFIMDSLIFMGFMECDAIHWLMHCDITAWRSHMAFSIRMSIQFIIIDGLQQSVFSILVAFIIAFDALIIDFMGNTSWRNFPSIEVVNNS